MSNSVIERRYSVATSNLVKKTEERGCNRDKYTIPSGIKEIFKNFLQENASSNESVLKVDKIQVQV